MCSKCNINYAVYKAGLWWLRNAGCINSTLEQGERVSHSAQKSNINYAVRKACLWCTGNSGYSKEQEERVFQCAHSRSNINPVDTTEDEEYLCCAQSMSVLYKKLNAGYMKEQEDERVFQLLSQSETLTMLTSGGRRRCTMCTKPV